MANTTQFFNRWRSNLVYITEQANLNQDGLVNEEPIMLDATTNFAKRFSAQVTDNPVADGTDVADNYRVMPPTLNMSGVISNDSVNFYPWLSKGQRGELDNSGTRSQRYVERLESILEGKKMVTVYFPDGLKTEDCFITDLDIERDKEQGNGFRVDISFKKVRLTQGVIQSKPSEDTADSVSATSKKGSASTKSATANPNVKPLAIPPARTADTVTVRSVN